MTVSAYVLIQTEVGKAAAVARTVSGIAGVVTAEDVTGPYDLIVRVAADTMDELGRMVVSRVQTVEGITRTVTCPVVNLDLRLDDGWKTDLACRLYRCLWVTNQYTCRSRHAVARKKILTLILE